MRIKAILNRDSGTLRNLDIAMLCQRLGERFGANGHEIACDIVRGRDLARALDAAADDSAVEAIAVAGGDGTISSAAGLCWRAQKTLVVLPGGTMNMYARTLGLPMDIFAAVDAIAAGTVVGADIATANGRPFVHQFSVGLHPRLVRIRKRLAYNSRFGKMIASARALGAAISRPPALPATIETDAGSRREVFSLLGVSNNRFGEGHLPYADTLNEGLLGLYWARVLNRRDGFRLTKDAVLGTWSTNPDVTVEHSRRVRLHFDPVRRQPKCVIDGELLSLEESVDICMHAGELSVMKPVEAVPSVLDAVLPGRNGAGPAGAEPAS
ncbi:diacylglycerol/lipid kinase family protein [Rhodobium gokarnense]|uniref:Diacylglycerol kinase family enzyme n=1 Tax=Rhodobium gokarnense TaxID=364296 RepID=A0ABT3H8F1_9HYPH|nr:diacylglycerol kinase family protein [Rhodobium gokarnense]MCW2306614.1 diacylglycerol kinase family enzyme [Rhodobium gokarnense]